MTGEHEQRQLATGEVADIAPKIWDAFTVLANAHAYARNTEVDAWEFSIEIERLLARGLETSDLRWLVRMGYLQHAREITQADDTERRFQSSPNNAFTKETCFVLTNSGLSIASGEDARPVVLQMVVASSPTLTRSDFTPRWDRVRRTLFVGNHVVKRFKLPSPNQEAVLNAFEEEAWGHRVFDPLRPQEEHVTKHRLRWTINRLNRNQEQPLIRFFTDGSGEAVCWELAESGSSANTNRKKIRVAA
ncbi:MAG: hypothetical protein WCJ35_26295 [Planctomycetota bacterium]